MRVFTEAGRENHPAKFGKSCGKVANPGRNRFQTERSEKSDAIVECRFSRALREVDKRGGGPDVPLHRSIPGTIDFFIMTSESVNVPGGPAGPEHLRAEFWMPPFPKAAEHVFPTMLGATCKTGLSEHRSARHRMYDVTSVIGLSGPVTGSVAFSVVRQGALAILERMTGIQAEEVDDLVCDCVGEMANMIAGRAKVDLAPFSLTLGLPQVIHGHDYSLVSPRWSIHEWVPLETDLGDCALEICFDLAPIRSALQGR